MDGSIEGTVYLIHLDEPMAHAQHYIGWSQWLRQRIEHHRKGTGANFLKHVVKAGINFKVVRKWKGKDRNFERQLKNQKNARRLCPVCLKQKCQMEKIGK